jgi:hypothetical protein
MAPSSAPVLADLDDLERVGAAGLPDRIADRDHDEVSRPNRARLDQLFLGCASSVSRLSPTY